MGLRSIGLRSIGRALKTECPCRSCMNPSWLVSPKPPADPLPSEDRATVRMVRKGFPPIAPDAIVTTQRACIERLLEVIERAAPDPGYQEWVERR